MEKLLVIQLAKFGDLLQSSPLMARLKSARPNAEITIMVDSRLTGVAGMNPHTDKVFPVDLIKLKSIADDAGCPILEKLIKMKKMIGDLAQMKFDYTINLNTSRISCLLANLADSGKRLGPSIQEDRKSLNGSFWSDFIMSVMTQRRFNRFNLVDLYSLYADVFNAPSATPRGLIFPVTDSDRTAGRRLIRSHEQYGSADGPLIGFQLGSGNISRQWPPDYFSKLASMLINDLNARIVLTGVNSERHLGNAFIENLMPHESRNRIINLMGGTSVSELAGVLSNLDLMISTDTGAMHLAAAAGVKILAIFIGPAFCHETGPYDTGSIILQTQNHCSPCFENKGKCPDVPCRYLIKSETVGEWAIWMLSGKTSSLPEPMQGDQVGVFRSEMDDFGVKYTSLNARLSIEDIVAIALREAGRAYLKPGYKTTSEKIHDDTSGFMGFQEEINIAADIVKKTPVQIQPYTLEKPNEPTSALGNLPVYLNALFYTIARNAGKNTAAGFINRMVDVINMIENGSKRIQRPSHDRRSVATM